VKLASIFKILFLTLLLCGFSINAFAQDTILLTYDQFIKQIQENHPVVKQARLNIDRAEANMKTARGMMDPNLSASFSEKNFDEKLYFRQFRGDLVLPTPLGVSFVAGYENNTGQFLDPENTVPNVGLWSAGVQVDLLQGILVNERSTALRQAKTFNKLAQNEQQLLLNDIIYQATLAFLEWQKYSSIQFVRVKNLDLASEYFRITKETFFGGEKTAIDTLEAYLMFQDATVDLNLNQSDLVKARQNMENFLWLENSPVVLQEDVKPDTVFFFNDLSPDTNNIYAYVNNHPTILKSVNKKEMEEWELRLKQEKLKPKLKAKYNPLLEVDNNSTPTYSTTNYKLGFDFSFPLFLRSERGDIALQRLKISEIDYEIENKRNILLNKAENSILQLSIIEEQIELQTQNFRGYKRLLDAEKEKFNFGESSVFLVNKRQEKYIQSEIKLIKLRIQKQIELLDYLYFTNQLLE
jgi:outer membrane protein TolC